MLIEEVNREVKKAEARPKNMARSPGKRRRYVSTNIACVAVSHFDLKFGKDLKENTVRDWVKAHNKELQSKSASTEIGNDLAVMKLPSKRRGRPCLLEEKIDTPVCMIFEN